MNSVSFVIRDTGTGWSGQVEGVPEFYVVDRSQVAVLQRLKDQFLKYARSDHDLKDRAADFAKALDKKTGNRPRTNFRIEDGRHAAIMTYSLKPPAMWKQESFT